MSNLDRTAILAEADSILRKPDFSHQDKARVDSLISLADSVGGHTMALRRAKLVAEETGLGLRTPATASAPQVECDFNKYLRGDHPSSLSEIGQRSIVDFRGATPKSVEGLPVESGAKFLRNQKDGPIEVRAEGVGVGSQGGFLSPQSFITELESSLTAHDGLYEAATRFSTATGNAFTFPLLDDPTATSIVVAENFQGATGADVTFTGGIGWGSCPTHRCGPILVSRELAVDSRFPLSRELATAFGERLARGAGQVFVTNLVNNAASAFTSASATTLTADEIVILLVALIPGTPIAGLS
jgi:HK97 family phage major capsid protein